jgi:TIR domain
VTNPAVIFVSHADMDRACARAIAEWLTDAFTGWIKVFVSSDRESIAAGDAWFETINGAIRDCKIGVVLATTNSLPRPWINYEVGALTALERTIIPICLGTVGLADLPSPLDRKEACLYNSLESREKLLRSIAQHCRMPSQFGNTVAGKAASAPLIEVTPTAQAVMATLPTAGEQRDTRPEFPLRRLFFSDDRWTTLVYTCRSAFTGEVCPASLEAPIKHALNLHLPVDELQTFCLCLNQLRAFGILRQEDDALDTVICSKQAMEMAKLPGGAGMSPPHIFDRDLIVVGENNFSGPLLQAMQPYCAWLHQLQFVANRPQKQGRPKIQVTLTPTAVQDVPAGQIRTIEAGGGLISMFPSPRNWRKRILSLFGCHREGQFTVEEWLRGPEIEAVADSIVENVNQNEIVDHAIQIVVDHAGAPSSGGFLGASTSAAISNLRNGGRRYWATRVGDLHLGPEIEANEQCRIRDPMYDISLLAVLDEPLQERLHALLPDELRALSLYWEGQECDIGLHVTLFEFMIHDASALTDGEFDLIGRTIMQGLSDHPTHRLPNCGRGQIRGIDVARSAVISYVDFDTDPETGINWLQGIEEWCMRASRPTASSARDGRSLLNVRRVPFPPHVTLCRFGDEPDSNLAARLRLLADTSRFLTLQEIGVSKVVLAAARRRPYKDVRVIHEFDLFG